MTSVRPNAANGASFGLTPVIAGRIRPTPPRNSQTPMKRNRACGTAENQGTRGSIRFHTAWLKQRTFPKPVKLKKTPHKTCTVQSEVFIGDLLSHSLYFTRQHYDETRWGKCDRWAKNSGWPRNLRGIGRTCAEWRTACL